MKIFIIDCLVVIVTAILIRVMDRTENTEKRRFKDDFLFYLYGVGFIFIIYVLLVLILILF